MSPWLGQSVSWLLIILGWVIVNQQNNRRETRKEVRASLVELYKHLDGIEDAAFTYHTNTGDPSVARKIKRDIKQITPRIVMASRGPMKVHYARPLYAFRRAVTLENFETATFVPKSPNDPLFDGIAAAKSELIMSMESAFSTAYPT